MPGVTVDEEGSAARRPALSIVVGCVGDATGATRCLEALDEQIEDAEVLVCTPRPVPAAMQARFAQARFHERPGALVPELWRDGIDRARGDIVALTISPMIPAPDWAATARREAEIHGVVAGAIDPLDALPLADLAECLCRYARDMTPFEARESADIPGDNCAYRRDLLERTRELWADGFWEPVVNGALARDGLTPRHDPSLRVHQGRSAGGAAFLRQRLVHGRAHGRQRGSEFGPARNVVGVLAAPVVPLVLLARTYRELLARGRCGARTIAALPWLVAYDVAWAVGEARGHVDALRKS
jgi:hypothetical protein